MKKEDALKLRAGDVVKIRRGWNDTSTVTLLSSVKTRNGKTVFEVRRHMDGAEFTVSTGKVTEVVSLKMERK